MARFRVVEVQYGREQGMLRISDSALGKWLALRSIPKTGFLDQLEKQFGARLTYGRLASGTQYADKITRPLWQISVPGTPLESLFEDDVAQLAPVTCEGEKV